MTNSSSSDHNRKINRIKSFNFKKTETLKLKNRYGKSSEQIMHLSDHQQVMNQAMIALH